MNISSGMSSSQTLDSQRPAFQILFRFHWSVSACSSGIQTACTAHANFTFCLRVQVYENFTLEQPRFELLRSRKSGLLVKSDENLNRAVFDVIGFEHSQGHSHAKTVIGTEGCSLCPNPVSVYVCLDRVILEIVDRIGILLCNHIHMSLKDNTFHIFTSRSGRFAYDHVADRLVVNNGLKATADSPVVKVTRNFFLVLGRPRNLSEPVKVLPHQLWIQIFDSHNIIIVLIVYLEATGTGTSSS